MKESDRRSFVTSTQMILKGAVSLAKDIKQFVESCFGDISRVAAHIELAYHQVGFKPSPHLILFVHAFNYIHSLFVGESLRSPVHHPHMPASFVLSSEDAFRHFAQFRRCLAVDGADRTSPGLRRFG